LFGFFLPENKYLITKQLAMTRLFLSSFLCLLGIALQAQDEPEDLLPADFHKNRREALRKLLPPKGVAVFFANPVRNRSNDVDYLYHQDPNFYYLTGYQEPNALLILFAEPQTDEKGNVYTELFFAQSRDPQRERWDGKRLGPEGVKSKLNIANTYDHKAFKEHKIDFSAFDKVLFFDFKNDVRDTYDNADLYDLIQQFRDKAGIPNQFNGTKETMYAQMREVTDDNYQQVAETVFARYGRNPGLRNDEYLQAFIKAGSGKEAKKVVAKIPTLPKNLDPSSLGGKMAELREVKSAMELKLLRKAVEVSCQGQVEVMKAMHPAMSEMEIKGIHEFVFRKYGSEFEGYPSIVGSGHNACVLHYVENNRQRVASDLVLMDLGAEYHGYTADITRTIPADGTFSPEQKAIYNIVLEAQEAAFKVCKPGTPMRETTRICREIVDKRLVEIGLVKAGEQHDYFPHGVSHHIGLDVHDPGRSPNLAEGMVITVEPGVYIPPNSPCDPKWWGIGVRIEDDLLITKDGYELLSKGAPRTVEEIEKMMALPSPLDAFLLPNLDKKN
jgi:Xaa-Pro aminopeptidase